MKIFRKLFDTKVSTSYMFILFGISGLMLMGYFSYAWFTVQGVQQYSVVTGTLNGTVAIGSNSVTINGTGVITYTPSTDSDTITLTVTNTSDRTVKNSIYYYDLSDSSIKIGYTVDSPTIPEVTGVSVERGGILTYYIKITGATGKQIKIGSSMGLNNSNLTLPVGTNAFEKLEPTGAENLIANANKEDLDYNTATDDQKNQMWKFSHDKTDQTEALTDYRYIGSSPNNYVTFNDEVWRIIGVFDGKLKLIKNENIGTFSWDNKDTSTGAETVYGKNDWTTARLMKLLNPSDYYEVDSNDNNLGQSLYYNSASGKCYRGQNNATVDCDFTSTGIKNDTTRNMIAETTYNLGGWNTFVVYPNEIYEYERGTTVYTGRTTTPWTGKIALAYPSDYGYAADLNQCKQTLANYDNSTCTSNNWMKSIITNNGSNDGWLLTTYSSYSYIAGSVYSGGIVSGNRAYILSYVAVPVLSLSSELGIESGGDGSSSNPYKLSA